MTIDRNALRTLLAAGEVAGSQRGTLTELFLTDMEPLLAAIESGELPFAASGTLNDDGLAAALISATGQTETHFVIDISSSAELLQDEYAFVNGYALTLPKAMTQYRRRAFDEAYGWPKLDALLGPLWELFGGRYYTALGRTCDRFMGDVNFDLAYPVACGAMVVVAFAAGYVIAGDAKQYGQLRPLLPFLPLTAPIGIPADETSLWLTLVR